MNQNGRERCVELEERFRNAPREELYRRLIQRRNMGMLCHCSAEIDKSTLLYFSVNNMFLGTGDYILLLFTETSNITEEQNEGMDVFSRSYTYTIIQQEVEQIMGGHFTLYPCELDGRLVVLILFHYGILAAQKAGLLGIISEHCTDVSIHCKNAYDMHVQTYISEVFDDISLLSSIYHKMLSLVTLHQFLHRFPEDPVYIIKHPRATDAPPVGIDFNSHAVTLVNLIINEENVHDSVEELLSDFINLPFMSTDELKIQYGSFFESLCKQLKLRGIRFNDAVFRAEMIGSVMNSSHWASLAEWMHHFTDHMVDVSHNKYQSIATGKYQDALHYIDEHLGNPMLSVRDIAEALGLTTPTLIHVFKKNLDTTPAKYIREKRLEESLALLKDSDKSLQEICDLCGFGSMETFHRTFKSTYGLPPGQFRKLHS